MTQNSTVQKDRGQKVFNSKTWWAWFLGACLTTGLLTGCSVNVQPVRERPVIYRAYPAPVYVYPAPRYYYWR